MSKFRLLVAALLLAMAVLVDFSSRLLSVTSDALLIGIAVYLAWPFVKHLYNGVGSDSAAR